MFVDDTALVSDSREKLQSLVTELGRVCNIKNLKEIVAMSKVIRCSRDGGLGGADILLNGETLEQVEKF